MRRGPAIPIPRTSQSQAEAPRISTEISPESGSVEIKLILILDIFETANPPPDDLHQQHSFLLVPCQSFYLEMSTAYQANASPFQSWHPIASEPAISLTRHLAPEIDAKCLLLGCGDARNILFTIFNDENERIFLFLIIG